MNQILHGDARRVLAETPQESVDLAVTSPPYYGLRKYPGDAAMTWGGKIDCEHEWRKEETFIHQSGNPTSSTATVGNTKLGIGKPIGKSFSCLKCDAWKGQLGLEPDVRLYIGHLMEVCRAVKRVLKPTGSFYLNVGDSFSGSGGAGGDYNLGGLKEGQPRYKQGSSGLPEKCLVGLPWRVALRMIDTEGWILRNAIIWHKPNHMPSSVRDRLTNSYEFVFHFVKQGDYYYALDNIRLPHRYPEDVERRIRQDKADNINPFMKGVEAKRWRRDLPENINSSEYADWYFNKRERKSWHNHTGDMEMGFGQQKRGYRTLNLPHPLGKDPGDIYDAEGRGLGSNLGEKGVLISRRDQWRPQTRLVRLDGKNPGDVYQGKFTENPEAVNSPRARLAREGYDAESHFYHEDGKNPGDFLAVNTTPFSAVHFTTFPVSLVAPFILSSCPSDGLVLDPFAGASTVALACELINAHKWSEISYPVNETARKQDWRLQWLMMECCQEYVQLSRERLKPYIAQTLLPDLCDI